MSRKAAKKATAEPAKRKRGRPLAQAMKETQTQALLRNAKQALEERRKRQAKMLKFPKFPKIFMPIGFILLIVQALIPSSGTFAAMTIIPEIANSDVIKKDLPDLYQAAMDKLKESLGVEKKVEK